MDWRLYKAIYGPSLHHHWLGSLFHAIEQASIPFVIVITVALWLFARPGGSRKWKLAATAGLLSAGLALAINKAIATAWFRERPFVAHRIAHPWINSHDASFPSDHASASFAIATAVMLIDPLIGGLFLLVPLIVSVGRPDRRALSRRRRDGPAHRRRSRRCRHAPRTAGCERLRRGGGTSHRSDLAADLATRPHVRHRPTTSGRPCA